ncbi:hypothetical protein Tco_1018819 [Tanacetum coccineum]|uniref:Retrotransposon gag domain-containing protein n=1 Tax=Tanacetum coccineum TaxID=301880 RepID=A0ABQ5FWJ1_9ASTR
MKECSSVALDKGRKKVEDEIGSLETRLNYVSDQANLERERRKNQRLLWAIPTVPDIFGGRPAYQGAAPRFDAGNPFFFQNNDHFNIPIVSIKLIDTKNYRMWSTMKITLTGSILSSLFLELYLGQVYSEIAFDVWEELQETYDKIDGSIIFNVIHKINGFKQGELSVPQYHHKLNYLWREFYTLTLLHACTCAAHERVLKHNKLIRLMQFLMGLNDVYQNIRSNILARDSLPDVKEAFNVVSKEDSHRGLHPASGSGSKGKVQPVAFVVKSNNFKGNDFKRGNNNIANIGMRPTFFNGNAFFHLQGMVLVDRSSKKCLAK